jgi:hypothetical protein
VDVLQARSRQLAHDQACLFAGLAEIARAVPIAQLPADGRGVAVARAADDFDWAAHEIAAGLTWTPTAADRELSFALVVARGLPLVFAALERGEIDRGKAKVFADHLDPSRGELTPAQIRRLCERFVPLASGWTTQQLSRRLLRAVVAIDPNFHRRRYRRGVQERGVVLHLDRNGTATLSGEGLPPDEAAVAAARLDRLAEAAKRAGHPGRLAQITADLFLGMLDGDFHGMTEADILVRLLAHPRPEDCTDTELDADSGADHTAAAGMAGETGAADDAAAAAEEGRAGEGRAGEGSAGEGRAGEGRAGEGSAGEDGEDSAGEDSSAVASTGVSSSAADGRMDAEVSTEPRDMGGRWGGERVGIREGIEIRVGLSTLLGCDQRPGEIPGLGPVDAEVARRAVAAQRRGGEWQYAVVDSDGHLLLAGPLRRRPRNGDPPGAGPPSRVRDGVVEIHLTLDELHRFGADPDGLGGWAGLLAEIADRWAERHQVHERLSRDPRARFARGALARHVRMRDRTCIGPGCTRSARRSDLDHTRDHSRGGDTVEANIGPGCWRHHPDKDKGWTLTQPEPGHFVWKSPLGRTYRSRGEPIRPDLPEPDPPADEADPREDPEAEQGHRLDLRILWRTGRNPPQPPTPPPTPPPGPDEEVPPF